MTKVFFIFFTLFINLNIAFSQISNYKYLGNNTKNTILLDNHFNLFYSLKGYYVENVFFLKDGIVFWDKTNSKFVLLDYDSKAVIDEFALSKKNGYKINKYYNYNPFFFNFLVNPMIIGDNMINTGIVKTKRKLGYKGYQILNIKVENQKLNFVLIPFKPDNLFYDVEFKNLDQPGTKYKFEKGLAVLHFRNMINSGIGDIYQFFGKPFITKKKQKNFQLFYPSLFVKNKMQRGKFIFKTTKNSKSNLNLYQLMYFNGKVFSYRNIDDYIFSIEDSIKYKILFNTKMDTSGHYVNSKIFEDRKLNKKYIFAEYNLPDDSIIYRYKLLELDTLDKLNNTINAFWVLTVDSKDKIDFLTIYDKKLFAKKYNPEIPNEIGLYYLNWESTKDKPVSILMGKNIFSGQNSNKMPSKINMRYDIVEDFGLLNSVESNLFNDDTSDISDIVICQKSIKCLLKTINTLLQRKAYKYVFTQLFVYDDEDIKLLNQNREKLNNFEFLNGYSDLISNAYTFFDDAIWINNKLGLIEGRYKDMFTIFAIKSNDKYYLTAKVLK